MFYLLKKVFFLYCLCYSVLIFAHDSRQELIELTQQLEKTRIDSGISAAVVLIVDKEKVLLQVHSGKANWQATEELSPDSIFRIGSISKSFAGLLALRLQEKGIVDLSKSFNHYVKTEYIDNRFENSDITLAQLLEHTAGLQDLAKAEWDYNDSGRATLEEAFALGFGNHKSHWPPGSHSSYSNAGYGLVGLALEKASGKSYENLMHEYVFKPLGMLSSTLFLTDEVKEKLITGYNTDGETPIPYWHNVYRPFAAVNTNADDFVKFLQVQLNQGKVNKQRFLSKDSMRRFEIPATTLSAQTGLEYGYGLGNYQYQKRSHSLHGHNGDADGYLTHYAYSHESGLAYLVMINAFNHKALASMKDLLGSFIVKDLPKAKFPIRKKISKEVLQAYVGEYIQVTKRFGSLTNKPRKIKIFIKNNNLYTQEGKRRARVLFAVNEQHFRLSNQSVASLAFIKHLGDVYLQGDIGNFVKTK